MDRRRWQRVRRYVYIVWADWWYLLNPLSRLKVWMQARFADTGQALQTVRRLHAIFLECFISDYDWWCRHRGLSVVQNKQGGPAWREAKIVWNGSLSRAQRYGKLASPTWPTTHSPPAWLMHSKLRSGIASLISVSYPAPWIPLCQFCQTCICAWSWLWLRNTAAGICRTHVMTLIAIGLACIRPSMTTFCTGGVHSCPKWWTCRTWRMSRMSWHNLEFRLR